MTQHILDPYRALLGSEKIDHLCKMAAPLQRAKIVHVNSTKEGGGVAEILSSMVPLMEALGLKVQWHAIQGELDFFECTKTFHNLLQGGYDEPPSPALLHTYEQTNEKNAAALRESLQEADVVFIHDPQPAALIAHFPERKGKWIWRCHIDLSAPSQRIWQYLRKYIDLYDASIFSLSEFAQKLASPVYIIPPSINPFSEKNIELGAEEIRNSVACLGIDLARPYLLQVSRFDRFKDPLGVIEAYRIAKRRHPAIQLVLAGSGAPDDPEGALVLKEVQQSGAGDSDIHIALLPSNAHRTINALQRGARIVLQKSLREGFGLTVSEALWKSKPVIGGAVGGIRLQIINGETGFLVATPEEAADRIDDFLQSAELAQECGRKGKELVKDHFLITRQLLDYLTVMNRLKLN